MYAAKHVKCIVALKACEVQIRLSLRLSIDRSDNS